MEPVITPTLLASTGIDIPDEQVASLLTYMNEILENRVGEAIVDALDVTDLKELSKLHETASDEIVHAWIKTHVNNLNEIIENEVFILLGEATEHRADFSSK